MENELKKPIQECFDENDGDGEFAVGLRNIPYSVIGSTECVGPYIFTTKPTIVLAIFQEYEAINKFGMIGRYGLPHEVDLVWIRKLMGQGALLFLGDLDSVDLLIFSWLRESLRPHRVVHLGVNDGFLKKLEINSLKSFITPCTPSEQRSFNLLRKVFPDLRETIGHECVQLLEQGRKIESEIILHFRTKAEVVLKEALQKNQDELK